MTIPEWASALPESLHDLPHLATAKTPEEFKAQITNDAQWRGQSIRIPSTEAGEQDWGEFNKRLQEKVPGLMAVPRDDDEAAYVAAFTKLGRPTDASGYTLGEGATFTGDIDSLKGYALNANLTNAQFRALAKQLDGAATTNLTAQQEALQNGYRTLKAEWGQAYDDRMAATANVLKGAPKYIIEAFEAGTLPADQVRYFHGIAEMAKEPVVMADQEAQGNGKMTPEEAGHRLRELEAKYKGIKPSDPDFERFVARRVELVGMTMG